MSNKISFECYVPVIKMEKITVTLKKENIVDCTYDTDWNTQEVTHISFKKGWEDYIKIKTGLKVNGWYQPKKTPLEEMENFYTQEIRKGRDISYVWRTDKKTANKLKNFIDNFKKEEEEKNYKKHIQELRQRKIEINKKINALKDKMIKKSKNK